MGRGEGICCQKEMTTTKKGKQNQEMYFKTKSNSFGVAPGDQPPEILPHYFFKMQNPVDNRPR